MPLVIAASQKLDGNDGLLGKNDFRVGNRTYGDLVLLSGATRPIPVEFTPLVQNGLLNSTSKVYETNRVAKVNAGVCYGMSGYNSKGSAQFILFFDAAALPSNTAVPVCSPITVPASSNFSIDFGVYGRRFDTGIVVANSSTGPTLTVGSADCWFDVRYL